MQAGCCRPRRQTSKTFPHVPGMVAGSSPETGRLASSGALVAAGSLVLFVCRSVAGTQSVRSTPGRGPFRPVLPRRRLDCQPGRGFSATSTGVFASPCSKKLILMQFFRDCVIIARFGSDRSRRPARPRIARHAPFHASPHASAGLILRERRAWLHHPQARRCRRRA